MMYTLKTMMNLDWSREACQYVLKKSKMKGANWDQWSGKPSWEDGTKRKDALDACVHDRLRPAAKKVRTAKNLSDFGYVRHLSSQAAIEGCGNCGEFAGVAFFYLHDRQRFPIEYVSFPSPVDHTFVLIGREVNTEISDWRSWNRSTVICDPWGEGLRDGDRHTGTYRASEFGRQMGGLVGDIKSAPKLRLWFRRD